MMGPMKLALLLGIVTVIAAASVTDSCGIIKQACNYSTSRYEAETQLDDKSFVNGVGADNAADAENDVDAENDDVDADNTNDVTQFDDDSDDDITDEDIAMLNVLAQAETESEAEENSKRTVKRSWGRRRRWFKRAVRRVGRFLNKHKGTIVKLLG